MALDVLGQHVSADQSANHSDIRFEHRHHNVGVEGDVLDDGRHRLLKAVEIAKYLKK